MILLFAHLGEMLEGLYFKDTLDSTEVKNKIVQCASVLCRNIPQAELSLVEPCARIFTSNLLSDWGEKITSLTGMEAIIVESQLYRDCLDMLVPFLLTVYNYSRDDSVIVISFFAKLSRYGCFHVVLHVNKGLTNINACYLASKVFLTALSSRFIAFDSNKNEYVAQKEPPKFNSADESFILNYFELLLNMAGLPESFKLFVKEVPNSHQDDYQFSPIMSLNALIKIIDACSNSPDVATNNLVSVLSISAIVQPGVSSSIRRQSYL